MMIENSERAGQGSIPGISGAMMALALALAGTLGALVAGLQGVLPR